MISVLILHRRPMFEIKMEFSIGIIVGLPIFLYIFLQILIGIYVVRKKTLKNFYADNTLLKSIVHVFFFFLPYVAFFIINVLVLLYISILYRPSS